MYVNWLDVAILQCVQISKYYVVHHVQLKIKFKN
jgi:hypothetical protein